MQEDFGDVALQSEAMALKAMMIEAVRKGGAGKCLAQQAIRLRSLKQLLSQGIKKNPTISSAGDLLHEVQPRFDIMSRQQDDISAHALEISANSPRETHRMQFEDVESQLVVYSKDHAPGLRGWAKAGLPGESKLAGPLRQ